MAGISAFNDGKSNEVMGDRLIDLRPGKFWSYDAVFSLPISLGAKLVYFYLCSLSGKVSSAFPSYNNIAEACSISRRTAIEKLKELQEYGLIRKEQRITERGQTSNIYYLLPLDEWNAEKQVVTRGEISAPPGVQNLHRGGEISAPHGVQNLHPKEDKKKEDKINREYNNNSLLRKESTTESPKDAEEYIKEVKATTFGRNIPEEHVRKLAENFGWEEVIKACRVLSFENRKVKNPYAYLRRILKDGGVVVPPDYIDPRAERAYKQILKRIDEAVIKLFENPEINEYWKTLTKPQRQLFIDEITNELKQTVNPDSLPDEARKEVGVGIPTLAKIRAFNRRGEKVRGSEDGVATESKTHNREQYA